MRSLILDSSRGICPAIGRYQSWTWLAHRCRDGISLQWAYILCSVGGYNSEWGLTVFKEASSTRHHCSYPGVNHTTSIPDLLHKRQANQHSDRSPSDDLVGCVLARRDPKQFLLLTTTLGANDATNPGDPQHVDISKYAENLHTIISLITSPTSPYYSPDTRIIVITPPPINPAQGPQFHSRNNVNTKAYAIQAANVAEEMNVPVVDAWNLFWNWGKGEETALSPLFTDGLHLTPEGYQVKIHHD